MPTSIADHSRSGSTQGSALLAAILIMIVLGGLSVMCIATVPSTVQGIEGRVAQTRVRYSALAVVARSRASLKAGGSGSLTGNFITQSEVDDGAPVTTPTLAEVVASLDTSTEGAYVISCTYLGDSLYSLLGATHTRGAVQPVRQMVRHPDLKLPKTAAFSENGTSLDQIFVDSYDSSAGSYASAAVNVSGDDTYANSEGRLGSNASITLNDGSVFGDVEVGPAGILTAGTVSVTGSTAPATSEANLPILAYTTPGTNDNPLLGALIDGSDNVHSSGGTDQIGTGVYHVNDFHVDGSDRVEITGDVTLHVDNKLQVHNGANLTILPGASLTVYINGELKLDGTFANETGAGGEGLPAKARFFVTDGTGGAAPKTVVVDDGDGEPIYAVVYAPENPVDVGADANLFGLFLGDTVTGSNAAVIHYDEALSDGAWVPTDLQLTVIAATPVATWWPVD